jgi:hypothetical protein
MSDESRDSVEKQESEGSEAGPLALLIALVYGTGLATTNVFISQFGIQDFALLKPKALFTGAIVLGTIALISSGPSTVISRYIDHGSGIKPRLRGNDWAIGLALPLLLVSVLVGLSEFRVAGLPGIGWNSETLEWFWKVLRFSVGLYLSASVASIFCIQGVRKYRNLQIARSFAGIAQRLSNVSLYAAGAIISISIYVNLFCAILFESVPSELGGPSDEKVQLQVRKEAVDDLKSVGIQFSEENQLLTTPLPVLYESENDIFVLVSPIPTSPPQGPIALTPGQPLQITVSIHNRVVRIDRKISEISIVSQLDQRQP